MICCSFPLSHLTDTSKHTYAMSIGADIHNPSIYGLLQVGQQQRREEKVSQMIGHKGHFKAFFGDSTRKD